MSLVSFSSISWLIRDATVMVLVQILLVYVFLWRDDLQAFRRPGPRPKSPERWLLFWLVV